MYWIPANSAIVKLENTYSRGLKAREVLSVPTEKPAVHMAPRTSEGVQIMSLWADIWWSSHLILRSENLSLSRRLRRLLVNILKNEVQDWMKE